MINLKTYALLIFLGTQGMVYAETTNVNTFLGNKIRHGQTRVTIENVSPQISFALAKKFNAKVKGQPTKKTVQSSKTKSSNRLVELVRKMKNHKA